ncbi:sulfite exporter TauE/SafE family protein [Paenibacillus doosanensis]|uniref:Probable membrane transporter protein n=1 Tax=Paenibacillus konkukensis TaxID=2020716 RepID=A0ABY4RGI4_9BACL|nr:MULTISPECIES: sulfite exporter TauE/SafE family protein [Paenibacillus]MCS7460523.1 sulfite exporter TauE/SafE family protein [Paenibacillus doosanensis]UQZ81255.1 Sulfite exporter TauE/SafE [Paenibacillus konkukensis]
MTAEVIVLVIAAVFIGALMRAVFGFGEAIVSMPLLAMLPIPLQTSVSLIGLAGLTVALFTVFGGWRHIDRAVLIRLAAAAVIGIPAGLVVLRYTPAFVITFGLGVFLIVYGGYCLLKKTLSSAIERPLLNDRGWVLPFGFASGVLGSAYNFNGVPVVVYGTLRRWHPERFRGTLQAHFLISGVLVVAGHALGGLWTADALVMYGYSLPAILCATALGVYVNKRIPAKKFESCLYVIIIVLGILLLLPR